MADNNNQIALMGKRKDHVGTEKENTKCKLRKTLPLTDSDLMHVYDVVEIVPKSQRLLQDVGITTVDKLLSQRNGLKGSGLKSVSKNTQKRLYHFCLWYEEFVKKSDTTTAWREHFNEETFESFEEDLAHRSTEGAPQSFSEENLEPLYGQMVKLLHEKDQGGLQNLSSDTIHALYGFVTKLVMKKLPEDLIARCEFNVQEFVSKCIKIICKLPTGDSNSKIQLVAGRTQSGKSCVKAVVAAICQLMYCPLVVITKGVAESKDLKKKITSLMSGKSSPFKVWWGENHDNNYATWVIADTAARIKRTTSRVEEFRDIHPDGKFVVIVDECDAMYRTEDRRQAMEQAYDSLMSLEPVLRIEISATPIPTLLALIDQDLSVEMEELGASLDYAGITEMKPLQDDDGKYVFLDITAISAKKGVPYQQHYRHPNVGSMFKRLGLEMGATTNEIEQSYFRLSEQHDPDKGGDERVFREIASAYEFLSDPENQKTYETYDEMLKKIDQEPLFPESMDDEEYPTRRFACEEQRTEQLDFIPGTDNSVMKLYDHALRSVQNESDSTKQGVLLLDCTVNKVNVSCNVFQKAARVQNHYFRQNKRMVIVVFVGRGIFIRRPGFIYGRFVSNHKTVSEVLEQLDLEVGLKMPVFVFGYSKMRRCISYRSEKRVPTHMVLSLSLGYSNENYIQAIGRATFNGLNSVLKANGHDHVTVLTSETDLQMGRKYTSFVHEVADRLSRGFPQSDAISGAKEKFPAVTNYLLHSNRKTGQNRELESMLPHRDDFEVPLDDEYGDDFDNKDETYKHGHADKVMKAIYDLGVEDNILHCTVGDIMEKYNDTFQEGGHTIKKSLLTEILRNLKSKALLENDGMLWSAKNLGYFKSKIDFNQV